MERLEIEAEAMKSRIDELTEQLSGYVVLEVRDLIRT